MINFLALLLFPVFVFAQGPGRTTVGHLRLVGTPTSLAEGDFYYDTSIDQLKYRNVTTTMTVQDLTTAQTVSNKTFDNTNTFNIKDTLIALQDNGDATKQFSWELSGVSAGQNRVMTVPNFNFTPATLNGTESIAGSHSLLDANVFFADDGDITKKLQFSLAGMTTGKTLTLAYGGANDRTQTFQDATGTIAQLEATETLSGAKTFSNNVLISLQNDLRLGDGDTSDYVALQSPATLAATWTLTMPGTDGTANQFLQTDGNGVTTWATAAVLTGRWCSALIFMSGGVPSVSAEASDDGTDCFSTATDVATGRTNVNIQASVYSASPKCTCTPREDVASTSHCHITDTSTSAVTEVRTRNTVTAALEDESFWLMCGGVK